MILEQHFFNFGVKNKKQQKNCFCNILFFIKFLMAFDLLIYFSILGQKLKIQKQKVRCFLIENIL